ncbi:hypothetical protein Q3G72_023442 [Acer saccharum]|nr:hypothetical protein Q3G72_023442 [Acer saccharum]
MENGTTHPLASNISHIFAVCEPYTELRSGGGLLWGKDPLKSTMTLSLLYIVLANALTLIFQLCLKPFGHITFIAEMLSGIAIGPSFLSRIQAFKENVLLTERGDLILNAFERLALIFNFFLLHMYVDLSLLKRPRRLSLVIGLTSFVLPFVLTLPLSFMVQPFVTDEDVKQTLPYIGFILTMSQFRQSIIVLEDLKLLSSELGRTAIVSSLICWVGNFLLVLCLFMPFSYGNQAVKHGTLFTHISYVLLNVVIVFVFRPAMLWMMRQTPERKSLKETYIWIIILMVLLCSLFGESTGHSAIYGPIVLGVATPNSPPMGTSLLQRLGTFVWTVFMPSCTIKIGKLVNVFDIRLENFLVVNLMFFVSTLGKLLGTIIPSLYYKMPVKDAISLGLIVSYRGLFDILYIYRVKETKIISKETFTNLVVCMIFQAVFTVPVIRAIYDTSRKYMAYNRRTIQHTKRQSELRVVVCIHELDNLASVLNILEVCYPTRESPFAVFVLNLEELFGGLTPLFISHRYHSLNSGKPTRARGIIKCFDQYEEQKQRLVGVECFTSVTPYSTMHDDICSLANEKSTELIIFPFQNFENSYIRGVNKHVLDNAPCSVAIFFGHGILAEPRFLYSDIMVNVCCVFIGGPDDREALALGSRMVENPCIRLTVARFIEVDQTSGINMAETIQDAEAISTFKMKTYRKRQVNEVSYKEEKISQVGDTTRVLQSMENEFDLMLVGRRHDDNYMILKGLSEWTEIEELGAIGDLMLSWDVSRASILVVQQQALVVEEMLDKPKQL